MVLVTTRVSQQVFLCHMQIQKKCKQEGPESDGRVLMTGNDVCMNCIFLNTPNPRTDGVG